jgi:hypothetical protein
MHPLVKSEPGRRQPARRSERGQALILIAMAMIGLLAFIGLTIDAGILFIGVGHLRRAVDAAALAAAAQFREGRDLDDQAAAAREVIHLNGVEPSELILRICTDGTPYDTSYNMPELCPAAMGDTTPRKLIYIQAKTQVQFAFLTIIGFHTTEIKADAVSEAASVDVVLAIDTSDSMADDGDTTRDPTTGEMLCNDTDASGAEDGLPGDCHPFEEVKQAAVAFVERMYFPYDRVSIVTYDNDATLHLALLDVESNDKESIQQIIRDLEVSAWRGRSEDCLPFFNNETDDPSGCTNTSIGGGLLEAGSQFGASPRQEAVWVVILLTDGAANASVQGLNADGELVPNRYCPPNSEGEWPQPFCRDTTRYVRVDPAEHIPARVAPFNPEATWVPDAQLLDYFDADDFAREAADFVSCAAEDDDAADYCKDSLNYNEGEGGQGALMYSIGLGQGVIQRLDSSIDEDTGELVDKYVYSGGDELLRYIANVGIDGDPDPHPVGQPEDPCEEVDPPTIDEATGLGPGNDSYNCGNYYFSETGAGLASVFESIASRVFTRLTQ